jgi:hypothetical protein
MLYLPFWALPELRQEMVQILEEHDGTELIEEMPKIPEWAAQGFLNKFLNLNSSRPGKFTKSLIEKI